MSTNLAKRYLNIKEVSRYLGFSVHTLYSWVSQRRISYYKIGGRLRFDQQELDRFMGEGARDVIHTENDA